MIVKVAARVNTEFVRALTFLLTMLFGCLHRWFFNVPAKGNPDAEVLAKWIVKATYLCLWLTFLLATMAPSFWGDHIRLFLQEHNFALSPYKKIFVSAIALYVVSISMLVAPVMILMESGKAVQKSKRPVRFIVGVTKLLCVPVMFSLLYFIVAATYLLVPARFGGAGPDPILLWISPNSARSLVIDGFVPNDLGCSGSDFVVLRDLSLVHEGPDYYYLVIGDSSKGTYISKDMVKRRHWIDRMDQATIDKFKEKAFLCIPVAQAQLAEK
jgi:hypothetical protein